MGCGSSTRAKPPPPLSMPCEDKDHREADAIETDSSGSSEEFIPEPEESAEFIPEDDVQGTSTQGDHLMAAKSRMRRQQSGSSNSPPLGSNPGSPIGSPTRIGSPSPELAAYGTSPETQATSPVAVAAP